MQTHIQERINKIQNGEIPEGYQKTKIGIIPDGWDVISIGNSGIRIIDGDRGKNYPKQEELLESGHCLFLNAKNVTKNGFSFAKNTFITREKDEILRNGKLQEEDIILTTRGTVGNIGYFTKGIPFKHVRINSGMVILRNAAQKVQHEFMYGYFKSSFFQGDVKKVAFGSAQPQLTVKEIRHFKIPLPSFPEQQKIAEILSAWDDAIRLQQELIEQKKTQKRGLMQLLLSGKESLVGLNDDWAITKLGDIANITMGQSPDSKDYNNHGEGKYLLQGNADIKNRKSSPRMWTKTITKECDVDDILMTVRAPVGAIAKSVHNACIGRGLCSIKAKKVDQNLLFQLLLSFEKQWGSFEQGSTFTAVNGKDIRNLKVRIPNKKCDQQKIADILTTSDKEIELLETELEQLQQQKKGLMQLLLTGKIRVHEQPEGVNHHEIDCLS